MASVEPIALKLNCFSTACHLRLKSLEPKGCHKRQVPLCTPICYLNFFFFFLFWKFSHHEIYCLSKWLYIATKFWIHIKRTHRLSNVHPIHNTPINFIHRLQLWSSYFTLAVSFLTQPCLQLERFSEAKREHLQQKYGDMRVLMGYEILAMWQNLGQY